MLKMILIGGIEEKVCAKRSINCDPRTNFTEVEGEFGLEILSVDYIAIGLIILS